MDHIVDQHDDLAADIGQLTRRVVAIGRPQVAVVAMQRDVEPAERDGALLELGENRRQALREHVAFADDADQHDVFDPAVPLYDLVGDARQRAPDLVGVHHGGLEATLSDAHERSRSRRAMRMWSPFRACRK